eukprot:GILK01008083.1.p1 GENE.GILK01008083.1~~GILK01008083.1.p1  ORF type:complete len:448 (-),score=85.31 GILK01008083.1:161-1465(-)
MEPEVAVTASSEDNTIHVWEIRSGSHLASFKDNTCRANALCTLGAHGDYVMSAQNAKAVFHFWSWGKEHTHVKCTSPEKITSIVASPDGIHVIAGAISGRMYLWESNTGRLARQWEGHYKAIAALKTTDDGSMVISGGEDSMVNVWDIISLVDAAVSTSPLPFYSWSDHSLPVTGVHVTAGGCRGRVASSSLDRSCKIWELASGTLLLSVLFPVFLTCVSMDPTEERLFCGSGDGRLFSINLKPSLSATSLKLSTDSIDGPQEFVGHGKVVTSIAVSYDGVLLVSGSEDGTARVWDVGSRQVVKTFQRHKGPVSHVMLIPRPAHLFGSSMAQTDKKTLAPLRSFKRFNAEETVSSVAVAMNATHRFANSSADMTDHSWIADDWTYFNSASSQEHLEGEVNQLRTQVAALQEENRRWQTVTNDMYSFCSSEILKH